MESTKNTGKHKKTHTSKKWETQRGNTGNCVHHRLRVELHRAWVVSGPRRALRPAWIAQGVPPGSLQPAAFLALVVTLLNCCMGKFPLRSWRQFEKHALLLPSMALLCASTSHYQQQLPRNAKRHRGDSNPCGQSPMDFESISLATRTQCLEVARQADNINVVASTCVPRCRTASQ